LYTARRGGVRHGTRVRSAPDDDADRNRRQRERLQQLSDYCRRNARRLMFELLVPPTRALINSVRGDQPVYDRQLRPTLMLAAMRSLADYLAHKITRARPPRASHGVTEIGPLSSSARVRGACPRCKAHLKKTNGAPHVRPDRARHALHQYAAQPLDRRRRTGAVGTSGHADGDRADRVLPVATPSALRSARPALAEPRSLRALRGSCLGLALQSALSLRRQGRRWRGGIDRSRGGDARRPATLPSGGQPLHGSSRIRLDYRRRDHDWTAGARGGQ